ncbi:MAG: hypothetical protein DRJ03_12385 [Chloroflexi bacterium]|nr:MAG: hypothetical protein DRJ03_12385 [Chloroflexota bacterium]
MFYLSKKILDAYKRNRLIIAFIQGTQGLGKTTYALKVAKEVYGSWEKALDYMFFEPLPSLFLMKAAAEQGERIPLIIYDDAGKFFSKYLFQTEFQNFAVKISILFDVIRIVCNAVILTAPVQDVLKEIRKKCWWVVEIIEKDPYWSIAKIYKKKINAVGKVWHKQLAQDVFQPKLPDHIYEMYMKRRRQADLDVIEDAINEFLAAEAKRRQRLQESLEKAKLDMA